MVKVVYLVELDRTKGGRGNIINLTLEIPREQKQKIEDGVNTEPCRMVCRSFNCLRLHAGRQQNCSAVLLFQQSYDTFSKRRRGNHIIQRDESRQI